jgi:uncharacterized protein YbjT (DUF2867 family)
MSILIIGGTGTLGCQLVKRALDEGYQVKCLVRNLRRSNFLKNWGAELIYGDLNLPETIPTALKGVRVIIDASTVRPTDDFNAQSIDWKGKLALIEAAQLANIKRFIFFSFSGAKSRPNIPLLDLKLKISNKLEKSSLSYTIFECEGFFQGLIDQYAVPILEGKKVWLSKNASPVSYIDTFDAAKIIISTLNSPKANITYSLVGSKSWSPEEIVKLCERLSGKESNTDYVPTFLLTVLRNVFRSLEFTWNIADRLQFSDFLKSPASIRNQNETNQPENLLQLEQYLQDYFSRILKKLKETNYQQSQQNSDISFL